MNKVYACSDIHGVLDLWEQIDQFTDSTDKIYFLGDAVDRGPHSWKTFKAIYSNPKVEYIKGNHEDMLVKAMKDYSRYSDESLLWLNNGGTETIDDFLIDDFKEEWLREIEDLPTHLKYVNKNGEEIYMSHAGFTLHKIGEEIMIPEDEALIWDRRHLHSNFFDESCIDCYSVFGHTPIQLQDRYIGGFGALYLPGNKICIDNGAFFSGKCCLLDLDTFEEHIFQVDKHSLSPSWR